VEGFQARLRIALSTERQRTGVQSDIANRQEIALSTPPSSLACPPTKSTSLRTPLKPPADGMKVDFKL
jgi:hypothetical protein